MGYVVDPYSGERKFIKGPGRGSGEPVGRPPRKQTVGQIITEIDRAIAARKKEIARIEGTDKAGRRKKRRKEIRREKMLTQYRNGGTIPK